MFCSYCGKEINDDSVFCRFCGKRVSGEPQKRQEEAKVFDFGAFSYNEKNAKEINTWLWNQSIEISSISVNTFMNRNIPLKWETVPNRVEIKYYKTETKKRYTFGYYNSTKWIGTGYDKVTEQFEAWQSRNPGRTVVWKTFCGHQADGGSTQSIYFLFY